MFKLTEGEKIEGAVEFRYDHITDAQEVSVFLQFRQEFFQVREERNVVLEVSDRSP
jgi:hypothetical protein